MQGQKIRLVTRGTRLIVLTVFASYFFSILAIKSKATRHTSVGRHGHTKLVRSIDH